MRAILMRETPSTLAALVAQYDYGTEQGKLDDIAYAPYVAKCLANGDPPWFRWFPRSKRPSAPVEAPARERAPVDAATIAARVNESRVYWESPRSFAAVVRSCLDGATHRGHPVSLDAETDAWLKRLEAAPHRVDRTQAMALGLLIPEAVGCRADLFARLKFRASGAASKAVGGRKS